MRLISLYILLFVLFGCKVNESDLDRYKTVYYNFTGHDLFIKVFANSDSVFSVFINSGGFFEQPGGGKSTSGFFVIIGDSMIVKFSGGKKLIYSDAISPTLKNPLLITGYDRIDSKGITSFLYAFTDEHYSKAQ